MISKELLKDLLTHCEMEFAELSAERASNSVNWSDYDGRIGFVQGQIVMLSALIESIDKLALLDDANISSSNV